MRSRVVPRFAVAVLFCALAPLAFGQEGKVDALPSLTDTAVPESIRGVLDAKGYQVSLDDGSVACELWFAKTIPAQPKKEVPGAAYPEVGESTFVGVLRFPQSSSDFRGQTIAAGYYALRYELLPNDGNHLGASPNRDFLLLLPVASDTNPNTALKPTEVIDLSRKASGTRHPAPLSLVQPGSGKTPSVTKTDEDHWIFETTVKLSEGQDLPLALVVKGQAPQ